MSSKFFVSGLTILSVFLFMFSCSPKQEEIGENKMQFDTISITKIYHLENDSTQPSCNLRIKFVYPSSYSDSQVLESITNSFVQNFFDESYVGMQPQEVVEKYAENYINNYKEDVRIFFKQKEDDTSEDSPADNYFSYYETLSNDITFNKAGLVSCRITRTNYKGGSSSFLQYTNYVYDLNNNNILTEESLFNEGYEKVLNILFKDKLLEANKAEKVAQLENIGYFGIEEIMPNNNFLIDEKGITYTFNKGEYSALQRDEINIFLSYEEVSLILKEDSAISLSPDL
ncbi:DUF3298 domain-containing protein [Viscerimonas tarda]